MVLTTINGITLKMLLLDPWPDTNTGSMPNDVTLVSPIGKRVHVTQIPDTLEFTLEYHAPFNKSQGSSYGNDSFLLETIHPFKALSYLTATPCELNQSAYLHSQLVW